MSSESYRSMESSDVPVTVDTIPAFRWPSAPVKPRPLQSLLASAQRITSKSLGKSRTSFKTNAGQHNWQQDAWEMYDLVGEQRFLVDVLASRLSQAKLYVGVLPDNMTENPKPVENSQLSDLLDAVGDGVAGRSQLLRRIGVNLLVPGESWLIGIPSRFLEEDLPSDNITRLITPIDQLSPSLDDLDAEAVDDLQWAVYSIDEVSFSGTDEVKITLRDQREIVGTPDDFFMVRVWNSHPRKAWEATSPTKASLPVLRELVGLTMHISAQVDSRLAGAGILIVPSSAVKALRAQMGLPEDSPEDPFTDALMEAMLKPIEDRASASAVVPLVITAPDESADKFQHITFDKPLDTEAKDLRDEAIRRLALGQDAPPELLLGMSGMNHWGAWLVREDVVTTHLEPPLALICDALTVQYLRPVMEALGYSREEINSHVVWYDVSDLVMRPNRGSDAERLYDKGVLSDEALRAATGFDESDAPDTAQLSAAQLMALDLLRNRPEYVLSIGVEPLVQQFEMLLQGTPLSATLEPGTEVDEEPVTTGETEEPDRIIPDTDSDDAPLLLDSIAEQLGEDGKTFVRGIIEEESKR